MPVSMLDRNDCMEVVSSPWASWEPENPDQQQLGDVNAVEQVLDGSTHSNPKSKLKPLSGEVVAVQPVMDGSTGTNPKAKFEPLPTGQHAIAKRVKDCSRIMFVHLFSHACIRHLYLTQGCVQAGHAQ